MAHISQTKGAAYIPTIMVAVADGSEEIEAVTAIDIFRRAQADVRITKVGTGTLKCLMSRGVKLVSSLLFFTNNHPSIYRRLMTC